MDIKKFSRKDSKRRKSLMEIVECDYILECKDLLNDAVTFNKDVYKSIYNEISENFSKFLLFSNEIGKIDVEINWEYVLEHIEEHFNDKNWEKIHIKCRVNKLDEKKEEALVNLMGQCLEVFFYDLFIITNLSVPGCLCFYNAKLKINKDWLDKNYRIAWLDANYHMSSFMFSYSYQISETKKWPKISILELKNVIEWYKSLEVGFNQTARTRTIKAIFAIFHVCREDDISPTLLIWLAHALESLYDTPSVRISKVLKDRIFLFLEQPKENSRKIKKEIENFYDSRSNFVHGDFEIHHPCRNENLDKEFKTYFEKIYDPCSLAFSIVVGTLQKMIVNEWKEIKFVESYRG